MGKYFCLVVFGLGLMMVGQIGLTAPIDIEKAEIAYLFEEGKGKVAKDASNNKRNGSLESGVKYGPGKFGTGLVYDGKDDNLIVKGYHGIGGKDPRTVLYWFKSESAREHSWVKWGPNTATKKYYVRAHGYGLKMLGEITGETLTSVTANGITMRLCSQTRPKMFKTTTYTLMVN